VQRSRIIERYVTPRLRGACDSRLIGEEFHDSRLPEGAERPSRTGIPLGTGGWSLYSLVGFRADGRSFFKWLGVGRGRRFIKDETLFVRYYLEARWSSRLERSTSGKYGALCGVEWNGAELDFKAGVPGFQGGRN